MIPTTPEAIDRAVEAQHLMQTIAEKRGWFSRRYVKEHGVSPASLRALLEAQPREWDAETIKDAIEAEPELPGEMPDEMWKTIRNDRDAATEAMRIVVRLTKKGILSRLLHHPPTGNEKGEG